MLNDNIGENVCLKEVPSGLDVCINADPLSPGNTPLNSSLRIQPLASSSFPTDNYLAPSHSATLYAPASPKGSLQHPIPHHRIRNIFISSQPLVYCSSLYIYRQII
jgi:hypothetical protein